MQLEHGTIVQKAYSCTTFDLSTKNDVSVLTTFKNGKIINAELLENTEKHHRYNQIAIQCVD